MKELTGWSMTASFRGTCWPAKTSTGPQQMPASTMGHLQDGQKSSPVASIAYAKTTTLKCAHTTPIHHIWAGIPAPTSQAHISFSTPHLFQLPPQCQYQLRACMPALRSAGTLTRITADLPTAVTYTSAFLPECGTKFIG